MKKYNLCVYLDIIDGGTSITSDMSLVHKDGVPEDQVQAVAKELGMAAAKKMEVDPMYGKSWYAGSDGTDGLYTGDQFTASFIPEGVFSDENEMAVGSGGDFEAMFVLSVDPEPGIDLLKKKNECLEQVHGRIAVLKEELEQYEATEDEEDDTEYDNKLTDHVVEKFVDGLLITLGELEMSGQIPPIETPAQAKAALLGVIRRLYTRKAAIAKMGRKFARLGAKQFLRRQRNNISRSIAK